MYPHVEAGIKPNAGFDLHLFQSFCKISLSLSLYIYIFPARCCLIYAVNSMSCQSWCMFLEICSGYYPYDVPSVVFLVLHMAGPPQRSSKNGGGRSHKLDQIRNVDGLLRCPKFEVSALDKPSESDPNRNLESGRCWKQFDKHTEVHKQTTRTLSIWDTDAYILQTHTHLYACHDFVLALTAWCNNLTRKYCSVETDQIRSDQ